MLLCFIYDLTTLYVLQRLFSVGRKNMVITRNIRQCEIAGRIDIRFGRTYVLSVHRNRKWMSEYG